MKEEYIVYCDKSAKKGKYFGNFYGGAIVSLPKRNKINNPPSHLHIPFTY